VKADDPRPPAPAGTTGESPTLAEVFTPAATPESDLSALEPAVEALQRRPAISIRTRIMLAFGLIFALCVTVTLWSMYALSDVQDKIHSLELADSYTSEIQEARRYEKNFLLYGTNLADALEHLQRAEELLQSSPPTVRRIMGAATFATMGRLAGEYRRHLEEIRAAPDETARKRTEAELRRSGAQMVDHALEFRARERDAVHHMLTLARRVPFLFLAAVLALMVFIGAFLARHILTALWRFTEYAKRIGSGDFRPITPVRTYRDEFSHLAVALNRMVLELDHREKVLVESHKLRAIGTLVAGVAHELNNPLNNIMLTAAMLDEDYRTLSDDEKLAMVRDVIGETERSQRIVRNLLDFARESEAGIEPLDLGRAVDEAVQLVANQVRMRKAHLDVRVPAMLPPVHGDRQMLSHVFVNLILNALDAVPERGSIAIDVHPDGEPGYLAVDVSDNGPGIPEHLRSRIFDPFFTTKPQGRGTGLGLSVSQGILRKLGGYIRLRSRLGEGSTFTVVLPITHVPSAARAPG
jgi:two-component system, NtrC family, sensor kinase